MFSFSSAVNDKRAKCAKASTFSVLMLMSKRGNF
jgi:hypothetical protein